MRLRVSDPSYAPDLLDFLERHGAVAERVSDDELDAGLVRSYRELAAMRLDLYLLIRAWEGARAYGTGAVEILGRA
jgi:hypothetical protein